jgi:hypothetical protein
MKIVLSAESVCHDFCCVPFRFFRSFFIGVVVFIPLRFIHTTTHFLFKQELVHSLHFATLHSARSQALAFSKKTALHAKIAPALSSGANIFRFRAILQFRESNFEKLCGFTNCTAFLRKALSVF